MSGAATFDLVRQSGSGRAPVVWTDGERWAVTRDRADDAAMRRRGWRDTIGREMTVPATLGRQISTLPSGVYAVDDDRVTHVGQVAGLEGGARGEGRGCAFAVLPVGGRFATVRRRATSIFVTSSMRASRVA